MTESEREEQTSEEIRRTKSTLGTGSHRCREGGERKRKKTQIHAEAVFQMVCTSGAYNHVAVIDAAVNTTSVLLNVLIEWNVLRS